MDYKVKKRKKGKWKKKKENVQLEERCDVKKRKEN